MMHNPRVNFELLHERQRHMREQASADRLLAARKGVSHPLWWGLRALGGFLQVAGAARHRQHSAGENVSTEEP